MDHAVKRLPRYFVDLSILEFVSGKGAWGIAPVILNQLGRCPRHPLYDTEANALR